MIEKQRVPAGTELMRQGDVGDTFMILIEGGAAVTVDGEQIKMLGSGAFFGELALLPGVTQSEGRRMATVVTTETSEIGICRREAFDEVMQYYPRLGGQILAQAFTITN